MTTGFEPTNSDARAALNAARFVLSPESNTPAPGVWASAQQVLRAVTARPELSGQALIGEARRMGALTLTDAHALVALVTWADASDRSAESESERTLLREAWSALDHAVQMNRATAFDAPLRPTVNDMPAIGAPIIGAPRVGLDPPATREPYSSGVFDAPTSRRVPAGLIVGVLVTVIVIAAGAWWMLSQRSDRAYSDGVAAYARGAREVARTAFAQAAQRHPDDAGPLVFLGRMSREDGDLTRARRALVLALARLVEHRSTEPGPHLIRLQRYCRVIAEAAKKLPAFAEQIDDTFVETLEDIVPLHDIGKVALPDHILLKPGKLDRDERMLMQAHTTIGADTLGEVAQYYGVAGGFWQLAVDVVRHHHERYDGTGYPDRLAGTDIPLAARIVAIADVYDALRSRRVYKPALSHPMTVMAIRESSPGQFDPALLTAFEQVTSAFERIFREIPD